MPQQSHQVSAKLTIDGVVGASPSMVVDGSVTPVTFAYTPRIVNPGPSQDLYQFSIEKMVVVMDLDNKLPDDAILHYGLGPALDNGIVLQYRSTALFGQPERVTSAADTIISNGGWIAGAGFVRFDVIEWDKTEFLSGVNIFQTPTILYPGARFEVVINDNLADIVRNFNGHSVAISGTESPFIASF